MEVMEVKLDHRQAMGDATMTRVQPSSVGRWFGFACECLASVTSLPRTLHVPSIADCSAPHCTLPLTISTMPSAINPLPVLRTVAFRPRLAVARRSNVVVGVSRRTFADSSKDLPKAEGENVGPNMQQAEHVSEEAAKMAKIQGGKGPDIEGQGTPVQDVSGCP